jgi:hypothetical protein
VKLRQAVFWPLTCSLALDIVRRFSSQRALGLWRIADSATIGNSPLTGGAGQISGIEQAATAALGRTRAVAKFGVWFFLEKQLSVSNYNSRGGRGLKEALARRLTRGG